MTHIRELNEEETAEAVAQEDAAVAMEQNNQKVRSFTPHPAPPARQPMRASDQIDRLIAGLEQRINVLRSLKNSL